jgi:alpha-tubulin suppressor-like RCC1 family protein
MTRHELPARPARTAHWLTAGAAGLLALAVAALPAGARAADMPSGSASRAEPAAAGSGMVLAWGANSNGELGDGSMTDRAAPVPVHLPLGTVVTSVRAGCDHSLALTRAGRVLAWGFNGDGQLGDGTRKTRLAPVPVRLPAGTKVTAVRAGCGFSLALTAAGRVFAWGNDEDGELGNNQKRGSKTVPVPVRLPAGTTIKAISAGDDFSLALTAKGGVLAWGVDLEGQLGEDGSASSRSLPVRVRLPVGTTATAVAAGGEFSTAVTRSGRVLAWGDNTSGALGNGQMGGEKDLPVPVKLPAGVKVRGVFAGCGHSLALTAAGTLLAWGMNLSGQLGDGSTTSKDRPVQVRLPDGTQLTAISAGCRFSMALRSNAQILAWGAGDRGQLGDGGDSDTALPVPVSLPPADGAIAIGSGPLAEHGMAIVSPAA